MLVIHGTEDEVIDFSHGLGIFEKCPKAVEPLWVEGAGHNDVELFNQYLDRLKKFVSIEIHKSQTNTDTTKGSTDAVNKGGIAKSSDTATVACSSGDNKKDKTSTTADDANKSDSNAEDLNGSTISSITSSATEQLL